MRGNRGDRRECERGQGECGRGQGEQGRERV